MVSYLSLREFFLNLQKSARMSRMIVIRTKIIMPVTARLIVVNVLSDEFADGCFGVSDGGFDVSSDGVLMLSSLHVTLH